VILTIDVDGVIAEMGECDFDRTLRSPKTYRAKRPHSLINLQVLNGLIEDHDVYFVSARSFPRAAYTTQSWLERIGVDVDNSLGVICLEGIGRKWEAGEVPYEYGLTFKAELVGALGSALHIDDHSSIIALIPPERACLYYNPSYPENVKAMGEGGWHKAFNWTDIQKIVKEIA
jgi:hypothetical protein